MYFFHIPPGADTTQTTVAPIVPTLALANQNPPNIKASHADGVEGAENLKSAALLNGGPQPTKTKSETLTAPQTSKTDTETTKNSQVNPGTSNLTKSNRTQQKTTAKPSDAEITPTEGQRAEKREAKVVKQSSSLINEGRSI